MNARETFQALLDGETIIARDGSFWRLDEYNKLVLRKPERERWARSYSIFNNDCEIYNEYPLTFEQALREMLDGKTVMCEVFNDRKYLFSDGWFRFQYHDDEWIQADWFEMRMRDAKWKVVE